MQKIGANILLLLAVYATQNECFLIQSQKSSVSRISNHGLRLGSTFRGHRGVFGGIPTPTFRSRSTNCLESKLDSELDKVISTNTDSWYTSILQPVLQPGVINGILMTSATMFLLSAPLGMMLDNYHGLFGVLEYNPIGIPIRFSFDGHLLLKTATWVPFLFGVAGFLMSFIILTLDKIMKTQGEYLNPSWSKILYGISMFSGQYYLSGFMDNVLKPDYFIHSILFSIATLGVKVFDGSKAGCILAIATAIGGPIIELFLINTPQLYQYTHQDFYGICSWIPWVYYLGAPAVGNLARKIDFDNNPNNFSDSITVDGKFEQISAVSPLFIIFICLIELYSK